MSYTYTTYVAALRAAITLPATNAAFTAYIPTVIDMAEQRMYRDLDLINTIIVNNAGVTTPNQRAFTTPIVFVDIQEVNILNSGTRVSQCTKLSRIAINRLYPNDAAVLGTVPNRWAPLTDQTILLAPSPPSAFNVEVIGTVRPVPLSNDNSTTYLSLNLPDLFLAASMVAATAYKQDWGSNKDNPQMALSWEDYYTKNISAAQNEETKRKYQAFASA